MIDEKNFQSRVQKIGELVNQLESIPDPEARAGAKQLVQALMDLHGAGLEKILEVIFQSGDSGRPDYRQPGPGSTCKQPPHSVWDSS